MTRSTFVALVTRFSVRSTKFMAAARIQDEEQRDNWFAERARLFAKVTLPSIRKQSVQPDAWFLLFAEGDERLCREHLNFGDDWIHGIFARDGQSLSYLFHKGLEATAPEDAKLLVSRIDNDDAIDRDYFKTKLEYASQTDSDDDVYLLYRDGLRWNGQHIQSLRYPNNPFISIVSRNWRKTKPSPLALNHTEVLEKNHQFVTPVPARPMWLQTLNGTNASNRFLPNREPIIRGDSDALVARFGIDPAASQLVSDLFNRASIAAGADTIGAPAPPIRESDVNLAPPKAALPALDPKTARSRRLNALAQQIGAQTYLEIGVATGATFMAVDLPRKVGVDPRFRFDIKAVNDASCEFFQGTSNEYFTGPGSKAQFDLVFVDGLHTFEQTLIDFHAALLMTHARSAILIDDTVPNDVFSAVPSQKIAFKYRAKTGNKSLTWHGDTYKLVVYINDFLPMLNFCTFNSGGNQQTLVWREPRKSFKPMLGDLEKVSRLDYFWLMENFAVLNALPEPEAFEYFAERGNRPMPPV